MKSLSLLSIILGMGMMVASCNDGSSNARSTPIDSTNDQGKAPVEYSAGTPENKIDTTMQSQPLDQTSRQNNNAHVPTAATNAQPDTTSATGNTTDKKTTSGSANNGETHKK